MPFYILFLCLKNFRQANSRGCAEAENSRAPYAAALKTTLTKRLRVSTIFLRNLLNKQKRMDYRVYCKMKNPPCFFAQPPRRRQSRAGAMPPKNRNARGRIPPRAGARPPLPFALPKFTGQSPSNFGAKDKIPISSDILKLFSIFSRRMKY